MEHAELFCLCFAVAQRIFHIVFGTIKILVYLRDILSSITDPAGMLIRLKVKICSPKTQKITLAPEF
jgi:hypothetical protein